MNIAMNDNNVFCTAATSHALVALLSLVCAFNKFISFAYIAAHRSSATIITIIVKMMSVAIDPMVMGKWHKVISRPVGKVNI